MRNPIVRDDLEMISCANLPWDMFEDSLVVISGANGFLPSYLVETFMYLNETRNLGVKVIGLVRNKDRAKMRFSNYAHRNELKLLAQDICCDLRIDDKVDFIIHAASQASPKYYGRDPVGTLCANVHGTSNLLEFSKNAGARGFLFFSSSEVYGQIERMPVKEDDFGYINPTDIRSCYAESKRMGENMCASWFHQYDVPAKIVRPFHIYGPGMNLDDGRVHADFISDVYHSRDIILKSDGMAVRSFCYLADATVGFFAVMLKGECGQAYNIGNDKVKISVLELAEALVRLFHEKNLKVVRSERSISTGYLKSKVSIIFPDISKVRKLGWEPVISLEEGFNRTIRSLHAHPERY